MSQGDWTHGELVNSARELVERLGAEAISYMDKRISQLERDREPREVDKAYRLLSEVERILKERAS